MLLSNTAIVRHIGQGNIVIYPYDEANLGTCSYDVTLGEYYYRETNIPPQVDQQLNRSPATVYNPFDKDQVHLVWGQEPHRAELVVTDELENIPRHSRVIWITPGETLLCHTNEFIGGRNNVTTMMKARSSMGRNFIEICKDAGWGDIGYINRWTMEVTNNSRYYTIPLVVGRRVGQMVFFETEAPLKHHHNYTLFGKYQNNTDPETLIKNWQPQLMLPKMYIDRDVHDKAT